MRIFTGDGRRSDDSHWEQLVYPEFTRDIEMDINGTKVHGTLRLGLHGNRFMMNQYSSCVHISNDEVRKIFPDIDESTYWPNGYNVGKYNVGGHDYCASATLTKTEEVVDMTNKGWVKDPFG